MTIKEIIDKERWVEGWKITTEEANETLDLIEDAVTKRIAELADLLVESGERIKKQSERIAELELRLECCRDASTGKDLLIAELEKHLKQKIPHDN